MINEANDNKLSHQTKISDKSLQRAAIIIVKLVFCDVKHKYLCVFTILISSCVQMFWNIKHLSHELIHN